MARSSAPQRLKTNWAALGAQFMAARDYRAASQALANAVQAEKSSAIHRYHIALAHMALGETGAAAEQLTEAIRLRPGMIEAIQRFGALVASRSLPANVHLNLAGLKIAMACETANREQISEVAVYYAARQAPLRKALAHGRELGFLETARGLCLRTTGEMLRDDLLNKALAHSIIRMPDLEQLLCAIRRVALLELPSDRFRDRALVAFLITLMRQAWINEYVWPISDAEEAALDARPIDIAKLASGDADEGIHTVLAALYQPVSAVVGPRANLDALKAIRPNAARDAIIEQFAEQVDLSERAARIGTLGEIRAPTSRKVAAMYEGYPYPRWNSLNVLTTPEVWKSDIETALGPGRLSFMDRPFNVLIAGCGTGLQAVAASFVYGSNAQITAIDLSAASLAYAQRMAEHFGAQNVTFQQGDILNLPNFPELTDKFQIIECTGVLHHMADPSEGLRCLKACLATDGLMLIALYSEIARAKWTALKADPDFPGEDCDDRALRQYRERLFQRSEAEVGAEFKGLRDLYLTSGFRDLILHVSEQRFTLPRIDALLHAEGLAFRGFLNRQSFEALQRLFPSEPWPGSLEHWAEFEAANPSHFAGMYFFWCDRL